MNYPYWIWKLLPYKIKVFHGVKRFDAYTYWPWLMHIHFSRQDNKNLIRHEQIHALQMLEWIPLAIIGCLFAWWIGMILLLGQPISNGLNYLIGLIRFRDNYKAYRYTLVEVEAYNNQDDENYIKNRIPFYWVTYFFKPIR